MSNEVDAICRVVLEKAYQTAPQTIWIPQVIVDYQGQQLSLSTIRMQLGEQISRTTAALERAPFRWATTGRWTKLQRADAFVLREAILLALSQYEDVAVPESIKATYAAPPWTQDVGEWLRAVTVEVWHEIGEAHWLDLEAQEEFRLQEQEFRWKHQ